MVQAAGEGNPCQCTAYSPVTMKSGGSEPPVKAMFPTAVDDIHSIDLQKQHENADPNMLVGEFIRKANEQAAAVILKDQF